MNDQPRIEPAQMCQLHQSLLLQQTGYGPNDPWRSVIIVTQIALFQAATVHNSTHERLGGDITKIGTLGCLACYRPDAFGEIVDTIQSKGLWAVKALGEQWVAGGAGR